MSTRLLEGVDRSTQLAGHNRLALLLFRIGPRQIFGINVFKVQEVIPRPPLAQMPGAHPVTSGVAQIRGRVIPIIDLGRAIGLPACPPGECAHVIVAEFNRSVQGFLVGAVDRIVHVDVAAVHAPPPDISEGYLTAITRLGDRLIEIIDVEKVHADIVGAGTPLSGEVARRIDPAIAAQYKVMVVDDSRVARMQVQQVLEQLGLTPVIVADGAEALRQLRDMAARGTLESLLMVISDVEMPNLDGYALTAEIRRDARLAGLYVMLHTSLSGVFNNAMVERVGANRFIPKYDSNDLASGVLDRLAAVAPRVAA